MAGIWQQSLWLQYPGSCTAMVNFKRRQKYIHANIVSFQRAKACAPSKEMQIAKKRNGDCHDAIPTRIAHLINGDF
jgi:hypothetical protein